MNIYIALFRGINVGGKSSLPMKELVAILADLGAVRVKTYIQSGNAIFQIAEENAFQLSNLISKEVDQRRGFAPHVLVLTLAGIEKAMAENPFHAAESEPSNLHLGFLASKPENVNLAKLESLRKASEKYHLTDRVFYLYAPEGVGKSRLATNSEKILGVPMTDRNWKTVQKIRELGEECPNSARGG
jgi:uncharacterized protein (DUF1697 family)